MYKIFKFLVDKIVKKGNNKIYYTTTDGRVINGYSYGYNKYIFNGAKVISNTYKNGQGVITFNKAITFIEDNAFHNYSSLLSIIIPNSVKSIGNYAFSSCVRLTSIKIPNSVTSIGYGAFRNCISLSSIEIPDSITIPDSVENIEDYAFFNCIKLATINIPYSIICIHNYAFQNTYILRKIMKNVVKKDKIVAYKGFSKSLVCKGKQYELDKINSIDGEIELCERGIHSCVLPIDVLGYYFDSDDVYYQVEVSGDKDFGLNDSKIATRYCKLIKQVSKEELVKETIRMINKYSK